jgi:hypothetical protein
MYLDVKTEKGILRELKGTLSLEGIEVSEERLAQFAAEYEDASKRGEVDVLIERAQARFGGAPPLIGPTDPASRSREAAARLEPRVLRRVRILASMSDDQLRQLAQFMDLWEIPRGTVVARRGDMGDAMHLILEGEFIVRINVMGKETVLATLAMGDFFGDVFMLDPGPHSADVVANTDTVVLGLSARKWMDMREKAPELAALFVRAIGGTRERSVGVGNRRYTQPAKLPS